MGGIGCGPGMASEFFPTIEVFEHGWPIPFGERRTEGGSNRFAVWSGDLKYSWPVILADVAFAAGIAYAIAVLLGSCATMRWQPIALTGVLTAFIAIILTFQIQSTLERCRDEIAAGERLEQSGFLVEWEYLGPGWWERLTGGQNETSYHMIGVEIIGVEYLEPADVEKTFKSLAPELPHLTNLKYVGLWDETRIGKSGADFEPRLRDALAAAAAREPTEEQAD